MLIYLQALNKVLKNIFDTKLKYNFKYYNKNKYLRHLTYEKATIWFIAIERIER